MSILQHQAKKIELVLRVIVHFALSLNSEMEKGFQPQFVVKFGAGEGTFAAPLHGSPTTGGSADFTGGRIRTPEPLRDRSL
jgi:hypothetical protein